MPEFIRKVTWKTFSSLHSPKYQHFLYAFIRWDVFCVCMYVFSVCWNQLLQSWECGAPLSPTWTPLPRVQPSGQKPLDSFSVGVKTPRHSSLKRYTVILGQDISAIWLKVKRKWKKWHFESLPVADLMDNQTNILTLPLVCLIHMWVCAIFKNFIQAKWWHQLGNL